MEIQYANLIIPKQESTFKGQMPLHCMIVKCLSQSQKAAHVGHPHSHRGLPGLGHGPHPPAGGAGQETAEVGEIHVTQIN